TLLTLIVVVGGLLYLAEPKITFSPFSIRFDSPYIAAGLFLLMLGIAFIQIHSEKVGKAEVIKTLEERILMEPEIDEKTNYYPIEILTGKRTDGVLSITSNQFITHTGDLLVRVGTVDLFLQQSEDKKKLSVCAKSVRNSSTEIDFMQVSLETEKHKV